MRVVRVLCSVCLYVCFITVCQAIMDMLFMFNGSVVSCLLNDDDHPQFADAVSFATDVNAVHILFSYY